MCDPVTATVLAVATAATSVVGQVQSARAQEKAIRNQREIVSEENRRAATAELFDQGRAARINQGRTLAAAGEAGLSISSGSVQAMLADIAMQRTLQGDRTIANMESRQAQTDAETNSMLSQTGRPTALGAGLQIGMAGASAFSSARALQIRKEAISDRAAASATGG